MSTAVVVSSEDAPIQFIDLKAQQARIRGKIEARLSAVLDHGKYVNGPEIDELEAALAARTGAADVVTCASGTDALVIPMMAEGIGPGDAVFIPAFTYNATANAVLMVGATPVFVDVAQDDFNMDPADLARKVEDVKAKGELTPRAVIAVDLFGLPANYPEIEKVAEADGMILMADGAQSFGGRQGNGWVGALAPVTATSFFPAKALGCYGDGGAMFDLDGSKAESWRSIRWHGTDEARRDSVRVGMNGRMDTMQAAIVLEKLEIFDEELSARKRAAAIYNERLAPIAGVARPPVETQSGYGLYSVTVDNRDAVRARLSEAGVPTAVYYMKALHLMDAFAPYAPEGGLPNCETLSGRILSLPMHPYLTEAQTHRVCDAFEAAVEAAKAA